MARPRKVGLDYFPLDVDFFQDIRIRKLRSEYKCDGIAVYIYLLCQIYRQGYYMSWRDNADDLTFLIKDEMRVSSEEILSILDYSVKIGLFDSEMWEKHGVLTSKSIQERYYFICREAKRKVSMTAFSLISTEETPINPEETKVNSEETPENLEFTPINSEFSTQSKEKKSKINIKKNPPTVDKKKSPDDSESTPFEKGQKGKEKKQVPSGKGGNRPGHISDQVTELLSEREKLWRDATLRAFGVTEDVLSQWLVDFTQWCIRCGKTSRPLKDVKTHFSLWLQKKVFGSGEGGKQSSERTAAPRKDILGGFSADSYFADVEKSLEEQRLWRKEINDRLVSIAGYDPEKVGIDQINDPEWTAANPPDPVLLQEWKERLSFKLQNV